MRQLRNQQSKEQSELLVGNVSILSSQKLLLSRFWC